MDVSTDAPSVSAPPLLVWFDLEFTTLDLEASRVLQVAAMVTTFDLRRALPAEEDVNLAVALPEGTPVSAWVRDHLAALVSRCRSPEAVSPAVAGERLCALLDRAASAAAIPPTFVLAGNSIHADWWLARRDFPAFLSRLHYRQLDVTAFKLEWLARGESDRFDKTDLGAVRAWFPEARLSAAGAQHDAEYDLQASVAELAFYRARMLHP